ncbi:Golgin subfamily A member 5 [Trichinella pseudospiralis]|uniref:Golgin subfamily A member 5 n=1 Tax=Trichinella pseudospiralis TaxID=6337 RepID=A0A0V0XPR0_TRIPS|nr:Golgin subfamily A member 5 [Trichinella pseudospiralis]KRX89915.1 Golgin subfamily A member 5 [Trichinella pseudospiralis]
MAWLLDLKNKAENFLDSIDEIAAKKLQKPNLQPQQLNEIKIVCNADDAITRANSENELLLLKNDQKSSGYSSAASSVPSKSQTPDLMTFDLLPDQNNRFYHTHSRQSSDGSACSRFSGQTRGQFGNFESMPVEMLRSEEARDNQVTLLRRRVQELEQALQKKTERDEVELEKALKEEDSFSMINNLNVQISNLQSSLEYERKAFKEKERQILASTQIMETENVKNVEKLKDSLCNLHEEKMKSNALEKQLAQMKVELEAARSEFEIYKGKANHILQFKEKMIESLKEDALKHASNVQSTAAVDVSDAPKAEPDLFEQSAIDANVQLDQLRNQTDLETRLLAEQQQQLMNKVQHLEDQLHLENMQSVQYRMKISELQQQLHTARAELHEVQETLELKLKEKDKEIDRLTREISVVLSKQCRNCDSPSRIKSLMDNLIRKQNIIEQMEIERQAMQFQLQRLEATSVDCDSTARYHGYYKLDSLSKYANQLRVPNCLMSSQLMAVYNTVLLRLFALTECLESVLLGYPLSRFLFMFYVILLHFWVLFVLFTYTPEMHEKEFMLTTPMPSSSAL